MNLAIAILVFSGISFADGSNSFRPKLSLKLSGGVGYTNIGDMNVHLRSINKAFEYPEGNGILYSTEQVQLLNRFQGVCEAELILDITKRFGIGIGFSNPPHFNTESAFSLEPASSTFPHTSGSFSCKPWIESRVPIKAIVYYSLPAFQRTNLVISAGAGLYSAEMGNSLDYEISSEELGTSWYRNNWETAWKSGLGFHAGIGAEYAWKKRLSFTIDFHYRYAVIRDFQAFMNIDTTAPMTPFYYDELGTLYRWTWGELGTLNSFFDEFFVWSGNPPDFGGSLEYGKSGGPAKLDMSGLSIRLGIKIYL